MFSVGDDVEFYFEDFDKRIHVQGRITRINDLGCFVLISKIEEKNSILMGGRNYSVGNEIFMMNNLLTHTMTKISEPTNANEEYSWWWVLFIIVFMILLIISRLD